MNIEHYIFRSYIALARCERIGVEDYTVEMVEADCTGTPALAERTWIESETLVERIANARGLSPAEQFDLGIVPMPGALANRLMCERLIKIYGLEKVAKANGFNAYGMMELPRYKDFIFPVKQGKWITRLAFYSIREMEGWRKAA